MLNKLERKLGRFAIPHLINYLLMGYVIGYFVVITSSFSGVNLLEFLTLEPAMIIHKFQIWRLFTWVLVPPSSGTGLWGIFFMVVMMFFYYRLGNTLEQTWGSFRFNVYMFGGMLFTIIGAFIAYGIGVALNGGEPIYGIGNFVSTSQLNLTIFLAFALCYPSMQVLFWFVIPLKMKWLAIIYLAIAGYQVVINLIKLTALVGSGAGVSVYITPIVSIIMIVSSLLNFGVFWLMNKKYKSVSNGSGAYGPNYNQRSGGFSSRRGQGGFTGFAGRGKAANSGFRPYNSNDNQQGQTSRRQNEPIGRHKCAICGRTDVSNPELTFRFCSKCNGNYEYCQDHLYTHIHKK